MASLPVDLPVEVFKVAVVEADPWAVSRGAETGASSVAAVETAVPVPPILRGWLHLVCFFVSIPAGLYLVTHADSGRAQAGAVVYAIGLAALFGVSGTYHRRRWTPQIRAKLKRLDHGTIFVMIAGTYTPLCLVALGGVVGTVMLVSVWAGAAAGVILAAIGIAERRYVGGACYLVLGWAAVVATPALLQHLTVTQIVLIAVGGVLYTVGIVVLGLKRPNPFPRVFGFHEIWHVFVVAAALCHYIAIASLV